METITLRGWQLITDRDGKLFWRDTLNPTHTYPHELALLAEVKREQDAMKVATHWRCPVCFEVRTDSVQICQRLSELGKHG